MTKYIQIEDEFVSISDTLKQEWVDEFTRWGMVILKVENENIYTMDEDGTWNQLFSEE